LVREVTAAEVVVLLVVDVGRVLLDTTRGRSIKVQATLADSMSLQVVLSMKCPSKRNQNEPIAR
jgi:hypothetical protein